MADASGRTHYVGDDCDPPHTWPSRWLDEPICPECADDPRVCACEAGAC